MTIKTDPPLNQPMPPFVQGAATFWHGGDMPKCDLCRSIFMTEPEVAHFDLNLAGTGLGGWAYVCLDHFRVLRDVLPIQLGMGRGQLLIAR